MGISGLRWLDDLVAKSKAVKLNGNGYPSRYEARAADADAAFRQELAELEEILFFTIFHIFSAKSVLVIKTFLIFAREMSISY